VTAHRPVVISTKMLPSYEFRHFLENRERMFDVLEAYYGPDADATVDLGTRYGATHLLVRRVQLRAELVTPNGSRWRRTSRPYGAFVRRLLRSGPPATLELPAACRRWKRGPDEVYDIRCIARVSAAAPAPSR
jgi:hypothetical protein